jgi:hypothetical protein
MPDAQSANTSGVPVLKKNQSRMAFVHRKIKYIIASCRPIGISIFPCNLQPKSQLKKWYHEKTMILLSDCTGSGRQLRLIFPLRARAALAAPAAQARDLNGLPQPAIGDMAADFKGKKIMRRV